MPIEIEPPWYLLYDGISVDGRGPGRFCGRTTNAEVARRHFKAVKANPYSVGSVVLVTNTDCREVFDISEIKNG